MMIWAVDAEHFSDELPLFAFYRTWAHHIRNMNAASIIFQRYILICFKDFKDDVYDSEL